MSERVKPTLRHSLVRLLTSDGGLRVSQPAKAVRLCRVVVVRLQNVPTDNEWSTAALRNQEDAQKMIWTCVRPAT